VTSTVDCVCFLEEVTWAKAIRAAFHTAQSPISQRRLLQWLQSSRLLHAATAPALVRQLLRWWDVPSNPFILQLQANRETWSYCR